MLGHDGGLPWWDLFAPVGNAGEVDWPLATDLVHDAFSGFSPQLAALAERAFTERWVDAEIRDGKRGGAYCMSVAGDVSRVMMNFDGSHDSVSTLAHELGHAYHNVALAERTPIQRSTPMALAETASIFCETLLFQTALAHTTDATERLALLDTYLVGAAQVVVDIHSRFLFESELCRRRRRTALSVTELCDTMLDAQERAYGDGLHPDFRHQYMWAVKPHYFTPFYNWPYTFGLLFGIGLYARYREDPGTVPQRLRRAAVGDGHGRRGRARGALRRRRARRRVLVGEPGRAAGPHRRSRTGRGAAAYPWSPRSKVAATSPPSSAVR